MLLNTECLGENLSSHIFLCCDISIVLVLDARMMLFGNPNLGRLQDG